MAKPEEAHALVSYFGARYKEKYGQAPNMNRYAARWGMDAILYDMSSDAVRSLIDYYLTTVSVNGHSLEWFFYNYDKLVEAKRVRDEDMAALALMREETKRRTEEWRNKIAKD